MKNATQEKWRMDVSQNILLTINFASDIKSKKQILNINNLSDSRKQKYVRNAKPIPWVNFK